MAFWTHRLWQRHNLRPEEFYAMPRETQMFYIASESVEAESPCRLDTFRLRGGG